MTRRNFPANGPFLPSPRAALLGRDPDVVALQDLLMRPSVPLVTLTGSAGIGKTRLAVHVAAALQSRFSRGACFIPLAHLHDPEQVPIAIATTLGLPDSPLSSLADRLQGSLVQKSLLLLLDNVEHVIGAGPFLAEILTWCPAVKILATSRIPLRVSGEHDFPVRPLALPESPHASSLDQLAAIDSVALFVHRATEIDPRFTLTDENSQDIAEICVRLDGIPLAIELAAGRTRFLTPSFIRSRLHHCLALLTDGPRDQPLRLRSMRDSIAWSYDLLNAEEQAMFRRLSVFVGGFSLETMERFTLTAGASESATLDELHVRDARQEAREGSTQLLFQLVDSSLVQADKRGANLARFRLLETIREFGLERLIEAGEEAVARDLHAATYLEFVERVEGYLRGPDQALWFDRIEVDYPNVRAALSHFRDEGEVGSALRLAGSLGRFWEARGHLAEGRGWLEQLLVTGKLDQSVSPAILAKAENWAGVLAYWQGDFATAEAFLSMAAQRFEQVGDHWGVANALQNQGQAATFRGDLGRGMELISASLARFLAIGDSWGIAAARTGMVNPLIDSGDLDGVSRQLAEGLPLARSSGDPDLLAMTLFNAGWLAHAKNQDVLAEQALEGSLALLRQVGDRRTTPYALNLLGLISWRRGERARSAALLEEALQLSRDLGSQLAVVNSLEVLPILAVELRLFGDAAILLGAAESLRSRIGSPTPPVEQDRLGKLLDSARALGGDEIMFTALAQGRLLSLPEAIVAGLDFARRLADPMIRGVDGDPGRPSTLTHRELEILRLLIEGHSNPEIATMLHISRKTVRNHVTNILTKLDVTSRTAAATLALRRGLV